MRTGQEYLPDNGAGKPYDVLLQADSASAEKILMTCPGCIYIKGGDGAYLFVNPEFTRATGYAPEILQAMGSESMRPLVHPEDRKRVAEHMRRLENAPADEIVEIEYRLRGADGKWLWCRCRDAVIARDDDGSAVEILGSFQDITCWKLAEAESMELAAKQQESLSSLRREHEQMEEQIRKRTSQLESTIKKLKKQVGERKSAQSRFRQLSRVFMDAADPIVIEDLNGIIIDMNREAENIYGWKRKELIGKTIKILIPPEEREKSEQLRQRGQNGDEVRHWEGMRQNRNEEKFAVLVTAFLLSNGRGRPVALATIARDISNIKLMEKRLKHSSKRLQDFSRKSLEALENDRQSVAKEIHDSIGASLAAIKFSLEGMLPEMENVPEGVRSKMETAISQLVDTIKETKQISASLRPTTLDDLGLLATMDWYFRRFNERHPEIELTRRITLREEDIPEARKIVIYRILQEALNNLAKHSHADRVTIQMSRSGGQIELVIEDNGKGFIVDTTLHRDDPFSGHGLANMRERTDLCGGSFLLFSRPGEGTRISVTLPPETEPL